MKTIRNIILVILALLTLVAGGYFYMRNRVEPAAPIPTISDTVLVAPLSELIFPVDFEVKELNVLLNTAISGKFFSAPLTVNNRGDVIELDITKSAPLKVSWQMPYLEIELPMHISGVGKVKIGKRIVSNKEPVQGDLILKLRSEISISENWKLITRITIKDIVWVNDPYARIAFVKFNLKNSVNEAIKLKEKELVKNLDNNIGEKIELKQAVSKIWMDIQKPVRIHKKEVMVWLQSRCESISARMIDRGPKTICIQVACYTRTKLLIDKDTSASVNTVLPAYTKSQKGLKNKVELYILAAIPFDLANKKMNEKVKDLKLSYEQFSVSIKHLELYGTDSALAMKAKLKGDIKGDIYFTGKVYYDSVSNSIGINNIKYDINTENALVNTADWILHDSLPGLMEKKLKVPLDSLTDRIPMLMNRGIEDSKVGKKLDATIFIDDINMYSIVYTRSNIQLIAIARAKGAIKLDKNTFIKKVKPIRITKVSSR